ncbi:helix-turn-helix domain-containing protein [Mycolicibacterium neoaurum]|uniref:helix-turn-helix domain-containing protein n=1 Tax=Mycolicibacterium neoaurum TaxID=1795 RepID=UPI001F4C7BEB|nr:helix-turn-helix transcriptional regulator [Mycolicibacterium neoaurum]
MEAPEQGIERLHHFVTERRRALGISRAQMFARGGPSPSTMNKALTGDRGLSRSTLERIDRALGWAPGSAETAMSGGAPTSRIPAPSDAACPAHEHVVTVLESIRTQLHTAEKLVEDLLGSGHAR